MPTFYVMRITNTASFTSISADSQDEAQQIADNLSNEVFTDADLEITNIVSDLPL
jgi:hypothetical protein